MSFSTDMKSNCVIWYTETKSPTKVQSLFRSKYGRNEPAPSRTVIRKWHDVFKKTGSVHQAKHRRTSKIDPKNIIDVFAEEPKQSLRRVANRTNVSYGTVQKIMKNAKFKPYMAMIVQQLQPNDYASRVNFAESMLDKIKNSRDYVKLLLFSDEAIFHLDGGMNRHNCRHWSTENPHWKVEKALNSPKIMVWAALGFSGIIGPAFFEGNVDGDSYLDMLQTQFSPTFLQLQNSSELIFMQDGAPPHWSKKVRDWLNEVFPGRWIGRGGPQDSNIPWPPRSPDLTPMDYFFWGFIKSKVYVRNYRSIDDLKDAINSAFEEVSTDMLVSTLVNFEKRLGKVILCKGHHIE